jgi:hypothetical protein
VLKIPSTVKQLELMALVWSCFKQASRSVFSGSMFSRVVPLIWVARERYREHTAIHFPQLNLIPWTGGSCISSLSWLITTCRNRRVASLLLNSDSLLTKTIHRF